MKQKNKIFERLEVLYLLVFILGALIIAPTHIFPPPTFMYARFPYYLELMRSFFGLSWPTTFEIYHYTLCVLALIINFNVLGIVFYPRFKNAAIFSSMIGIFLFSSLILFFFFKFISVSILTAIVYGFYSVVLLIMDLLTFQALTKK